MIHALSGGTYLQFSLQLVQLSCLVVERLVLNSGHVEGLWTHHLSSTIWLLLLIILFESHPKQPIFL